MELLYFEERARSAANFGGFLVTLLGAACILGFSIHSGNASVEVVGTLFAAVFAFGCCSLIYTFIANPKCEFGIRDDTIWWDSPGWRRSAGTIAIEEIRSIRIHEGSATLHIAMRDGTFRRVSCPAVWTFSRVCELRDVLLTNYPHLTVNVVEAPG